MSHKMYSSLAFGNLQAKPTDPVFTIFAITKITYSPSGEYTGGSVKYTGKYEDGTIAYTTHLRICAIYWPEKTIAGVAQLDVLPNYMKRRGNNNIKGNDEEIEEIRDLFRPGDAPAGTSFSGNIIKWVKGLPRK